MRAIEMHAQPLRCPSNPQPRDKGISLSFLPLSGLDFSFEAQRVSVSGSSLRCFNTDRPQGLSAGEVREFWRPHGGCAGRQRKETSDAQKAKPGGGLAHTLYWRRLVSCRG